MEALLVCLWMLSTAGGLILLIAAVVALHRTDREWLARLRGEMVG